MKLLDFIQLIESEDFNNNQLLFDKNDFLDIPA